jgi:hypothetical protein
MSTGIRKEIKRCKELVERSNPYLREAFAFACSRIMQDYIIPGYNRVREGATPEARKEAHRDSTGEHEQHMGREGSHNLVAVFEKAPMFLRADNCQGKYKSKEYIADNPLHCLAHSLNPTYQ